MTAAHSTPGERAKSTGWPRVCDPCQRHAMSSTPPAEVAAVHDAEIGRRLAAMTRGGVGHYPQMEDPAGWATVVLSRLETGAAASRP
jgi:hypothetical protein